MPIIFIENGRLGNQLFQYHGLRKYYPDETIFFIGFSSLKKISNYKNVIYLNNKMYSNFLLKYILREFLVLLTKLKIVSSLIEQSKEFRYRLVKIDGVFDRITVVHNAFFQHKDVQPSLHSNIPIINPNRLFSFNNFIEINCLQEKQIAFVHIRRGDYLFWPTRDFPAAIEASWYFDQMEYLRSRYPEIQFIVFTDDKEYAIKIFAHDKDIIISHEDEIDDFVIMSNCNHGILSASTFSWWSAYMAKISNPTGEFIAPNYWIGYNKKEWFPLWIESSWLRYV
jgi:hypothetical protein